MPGEKRGSGGRQGAAHPGAAATVSGGPAASATTVAAPSGVQLSGFQTIFRRAAVSAVRQLVVPAAAAYAPSKSPPEEGPPPPDALSGREMSILGGAFQRLACESGDLLMAYFPPAPEGQTFQRCSPNPDTGAYELPPLTAVAVSGAKAFMAWRKARADAAAAAQQKADEAAARERLRPISVNALRLRTRG